MRTFTVSIAKRRRMKLDKTDEFPFGKLPKCTLKKVAHWKFQTWRVSFPFKSSVFFFFFGKRLGRWSSGEGVSFGVGEWAAILLWTNLALKLTAPKQLVECIIRGVFEKWSTYAVKQWRSGLLTPILSWVWRWQKKNGNVKVSSQPRRKEWVTTRARCAKPSKVALHSLDFGRFGAQTAKIKLTCPKSIIVGWGIVVVEPIMLALPCPHWHSVCHKIAV